MSDQHPVYSPPPDYTPSPPPPTYGAEAYGAPGSGPPPAAPTQKKRTGLIIALVVVGLLLCCCVGGGIAGLMLFAPTDGVISEIGTEEGVFEDLATEETDERLEEWLAWDPESEAVIESAPTEKESLIAEGLGVVAPEFSFEEAVWASGEYDAAEDWYYADAFFTRATHPSSSDISAAVEMWIQSDQMVAEQVAFETTEGDLLSSVGGREIVYRPQWGPSGFYLAGEEDIALWELLGEQWPGGVVPDMAGDLETGYEVGITKWHLYAVEGAYPLVSALYTYADGEWTLDSWEYSYPEDSDSGT